MLQSDESGEGEGEDEDEDEDGEDDNDDDDENDSGDVPSSPAREHSENEQDLHTPPTGRTESSTPNPPQVVDSHSRASNELATSLKRTREEERKKGKAVARQLVRQFQITSVNTMQMG
jgi:protein AATF/BFR2